MRHLVLRVMGNEPSSFEPRVSFRFDRFDPGRLDTFISIRRRRRRRRVEPEKSTLTSFPKGGVFRARQR